MAGDPMQILQIAAQVRELTPRIDVDAPNFAQGTPIQHSPSVLGLTALRATQLQAPPMMGSIPIIGNSFHTIEAISRSAEASINAILIPGLGGVANAIVSTGFVSSLVEILCCEQLLDLFHALGQAKGNRDDAAAILALVLKIQQAYKECPTAAMAACTEKAAGNTAGGDQKWVKCGLCYYEVIIYQVLITNLKNSVPGKAAARAAAVSQLRTMIDHGCGDPPTINYGLAILKYWDSSNAAGKTNTALIDETLIAILTDLISTKCENLTMSSRSRS